jgi:dUTP pyrophosphatase
MGTIMFSKTKPKAVIPTKRDEDAGYDLYACIESEDCSVIIEPNETAVIPIGIISAFPDSLVGIIKERGSTGIRGIGIRAGVIDSGFRGVWSVIWTNHNNHRIVIATDTAQLKLREGDVVYPSNKAIAQVLFVPIAQLEAVEVLPDVILSIDSCRGKGKFGSSGK